MSETVVRPGDKVVVAPREFRFSKFENVINASDHDIIKFAEYAVVIGWVGEEFQENFGTDYTYDDLTKELHRRGYEEHYFKETDV